MENDEPIKGGTAESGREYDIAYIALSMLEYIEKLRESRGGKGCRK